MKKIILLSIVVILILGGAAGTYWWISRPQVIKFSDDTTLTLLGADYGKRHTVPGGKLPPATARPATQGRGAVVQTARTFTTAADTLVVWLRAKSDQSSDTPNQNHSFQFFIYDKAGTACGQAYANFQQGVRVSSVQFPAFPRRQGQLYLRVQEQGNGGQEMAEEKFVINNPAAGKSFAKWTPEPMPTTKEDDGLSVTLTKLLAGAALPYQRVQDDPDDVINKGAQVAFRVERGGKPVTDWEPVSVETTDATGNRTAINYGAGNNQSKWNGGEATLTLQNGLWPDEPAWKVRMEMTQTSDFSSDEQWAAQNIPVVPGSQQGFNGMAGVGRRGGPGATAVTTPPATPTPCAEADLGGRHIKVFPAVLFTNQPARPAGLPANAVYNQPQQTAFMIQVQPAIVNYNGMRSGTVGGVNGAQTPDDGMRLSLVKVTDGQGGEFPQSYNYSPVPTSTGTGADSISTFRYTLRDTGDVTNLNLTIALHKDRFFEFTAKPEKASAE